MELVAEKEERSKKERRRSDRRAVGLCVKTRRRMAWARTAVEWGWTLKWWSLVGGGIGGGAAFWGPGAWELAIGNRERNGGCWTGIPGEAAQNAIIPTGKG